MSQKQECGVLQKDECDVSQKQECGVLQKHECDVSQKQECGVLQKQECDVSQKQECGVPQKQEVLPTNCFHPVNKYTKRSLNIYIHVGIGFSTVTCIALLSGLFSFPNSIQLLLKLLAFTDTFPPVVLPLGGPDLTVI